MAVSRPNRDTYENREKLTRAAVNYRRALADYTKPLLVVNASLPKEKVAAKVFDFVSNKNLHSAARAVIQQSEVTSD